MVRAEAVEVLQFVTQGNDRLRTAIEYRQHRCRQLVGFVDDDMSVTAVDHMLGQRQQLDPVVVTHRQLNVPRRRANQLLPVQACLFQQHLLIQRRGARPGPGQVVQLKLGIGTVAERAHGADTQGNHITRCERADIWDGQPAHHLRFLGAPGQLGAVRIAQSPAVAGEVTVEQLVSQLAEGQRGIGGSVLDPRLQRAQLAFSQGQQQGALWLQQPGELVNQEGLAGAA